MYNRYIPQNDGSHRRKIIPEPMAAMHTPVPPMPPPEAAEQSMKQPSHCDSCEKVPPQPRRELPSRQGASGFLKNLLPGLDTEDLLILVLLLLISSDCRDDRNLPLLTLALYLFL